MSSQAALETPVKNAFGVADVVGRRCCSHVLLTTLVSKMPLLYASSLLLLLYLHNLHKQKEGRTVGGGLEEGSVELQGAHVQLVWPCGETNTAVWRVGGGGCLHATAGFDDYMLRCPYNMLIDSRKTPPLLCSWAKYRRNRNKAESLSTLEVHWSKTMAWLFINQLSLAKCLLRWTAQAWGAASASRQQNCWHNATWNTSGKKKYVNPLELRVFLL